jgi:FkbM family methyltransferase
VNDKVVRFNPFGQRSFDIAGDESDVGVIGEVDRSGGRYQREFSLFFRNTLAADAVIIDGGAHIGVLTVLLASLCPDGTVYAFEPAPATRAHLNANVTANNLTNVVVEGAVLYDRDGDVVFDFDSTFPAGSHVGSTGPTVTSPTVTSVRLDTWARERGIDRLDLLKLDVEGSELAVLSGGAETIRRFRPITVVECNPVALRRFGGRSYRELLQVMKSLFPVVAVLNPTGAVVPLLSDSHLDLLLADHGVVDLVGFPTRDLVQSALAFPRSAASALRLSYVYNRRRPAENKIVEPAIGLASSRSEIAGTPGAVVAVPTTIENRSRWWLSSAFPYHPVHVSYRMLDATGAKLVDGHRTAFPEPLGPGRSVTLDLTVELPAAPGEYQLSTTLVQEAFAWFDELNPDCALVTPVHVG